jgi:hypothetical protein
MYGVRPEMSLGTANVAQRRRLLESPFSLLVHPSSENKLQTRVTRRGKEESCLEQRRKSG